MNSCLYTGWVRHRRHHPRVHDFRYRLFDAQLWGRRTPLTTRTVAGTLLRYPFVTLKTVAAIHFEAARLYLKGTPVRRHPGETAPQQTQRALLAALAGDSGSERAPTPRAAPGSTRP